MDRAVVTPLEGVRMRGWVPTRNRLPCSGARGFTLAEVLMALAVLGLAALASTAILEPGARSAFYEKDRAFAAAAARARMETMLALDYASLTLGTTGPTAVAGHPAATVLTVVTAAGARVKQIEVTAEAGDASTTLACLKGRDTP